MASRTVIPDNVDDDSTVIRGINKITIPRLTLPVYGKPVIDEPADVKLNEVKPIDVRLSNAEQIDVKPNDGTYLLVHLFL